MTKFAMTKAFREASQYRETSSISLANIKILLLLLIVTAYSHLLENTVEQKYSGEFTHRIRT